MSYQVFKFTASTQAAVAIFHLFQSGLVNMKFSLNEVGDELTHEPCWPTPDDAAFQWYHLGELRRRLCSRDVQELQVKVHEMTTPSGNSRDVRKVEFFLARTRRITTALSVTVGLRDKRWMLKEAKFLHSVNFGQSETERMTMEMVIKPAEIGNSYNWPESIEQYFGGFVRVESSTFGKYNI